MNPYGLKQKNQVMSLILYEILPPKVLIFFEERKAEQMRNCYSRPKNSAGDRRKSAYAYIER